MTITYQSGATDNPADGVIMNVNYSATLKPARAFFGSMTWASGVDHLNAANDQRLIRAENSEGNTVKSDISVSVTDVPYTSGCAVQDVPSGYSVNGDPTFGDGKRTVQTWFGDDHEVNVGTTEATGEFTYFRPKAPLNADYNGLST